MFKIEDDKILWEGRVIAVFVDGLPATLRDNVESALECYEKDSVSVSDFNALEDDYVNLKVDYEELKNKFDKLAANE